MVVITKSDYTYEIHLTPNEAHMLQSAIVLATPNGHAYMTDGQALVVVHGVQSDTVSPPHIPVDSL
jgi:hypothetical protein